MASPVLIRGGGDLASGVALRLHSAGLRIAITELAAPLLVRRTVSFGAAVFSGAVEVEGVTARLVKTSGEADGLWQKGEIPVLVDPELESLKNLKPVALVDARMTKQAPEIGMGAAPLVIGLGPGFVAGENCHAVIETMRGHSLGRVIWDGPALPDTGVPGSIATYNVDRALRAPADGYVEARFEIGDHVKEGEIIAEVDGETVKAAFPGVLRGMLHPSVAVSKGQKIGDLDPRDDPSFCWRVSDKSLAIGGGVLEALLTRPEIRARLWD